MQLTFRQVQKVEAEHYRKECKMTQVLLSSSPECELDENGVLKELYEFFDFETNEIVKKEINPEDGDD